MKITKESTIAEVLANYSGGRSVFLKYLPNCIKCGGATAESIEKGARMHGVDPELIVQELISATKQCRKSNG